jgi:hypothetical protein
MVIAGMVIAGMVIAGMVIAGARVPIGQSIAEPSTVAA